LPSCSIISLGFSSSRQTQSLLSILLSSKHCNITLIRFAALFRAKRIRMSPTNQYVRREANFTVEYPSSQPSYFQLRRNVWSTEMHRRKPFKYLIRSRMILD
jgi:hypothetical protein